MLHTNRVVFFGLVGSAEAIVAIVSVRNLEWVWSIQNRGVSSLKGKLAEVVRK